MAYISFKPSDYISTLLYTGTGSSLANTGVGFQPDFTWIKSRSHTNYHTLTDSVRGVTKQIFSNTTDAEQTSSTNVSSFDSDGFTVVSANDVNGSARTYASWNWKMGTTSGLSGGTITPSSYSINTTAGQGVYAYTGNGTGGATIPHGLGKVPTFIMAKKLNSTGSWMVYHKSQGAAKAGYLDSTSAFSSGTAVWNSVTPTTTLITIGTDADINGNTDTFVMYAFCDVPGYFHTTQYEGSGAENGNYIPLGFEPAWVMIKETDSTSGWCMYDNKRPLSNPGYYNVNQNFLQAQEEGVESDNSNLALDFLSNGIKIRNSAGDINGSGNTYVVMAFAKFPLIGSDGNPGLAR